MRFVLVSSSVLFIVACGGSSKPAEGPPVDTSSLESKESNGSAPSKESTPPADSASAPASEAPAAAAAAPASETPAAPAHSAPAVTGSIDGKPFAPTLARVTGHLQKDGRLLVSVGEGTDCSSPSDATITMMVPWQDGYKVDLGSLKRGTKKGAGEIAFVRTTAAGKKEYSKTFKPSGTVTIVKAPMTENAVGKMKIDLQSGDYMLAGRASRHSNVRRPQVTPVLSLDVKVVLLGMSSAALTTAGICFQKLNGVRAGNAFLSGWLLLATLCFFPTFVMANKVFLMGGRMSLFVPATALTYVFTMLAGHFVFHESISAGRWFGCALILTGVVAAARG